MDQMLDIQIVRAISAIGPLERRQILGRVNAEKLDVEASLDALVTMGCLRTELNSLRQFEYRLKPNFTERNCKTDEHRQKVSAYVARHGTKSKDVFPVTDGIKFSEGLDRAIWKASNTGRWMMMREIRDVLTAVGFPRTNVIHRIQHHINAGKWFERQSGSRKNQFFMLRDSIECPELPGAREVAVIQVNKPDVTLTPAVQIAPAAIRPVTKTEEGTGSTVSDGYFPLASLGKNVMEEALQHLLTFVSEEGTLHEAIWAILNDSEEYSCADLVLVLGRLGFTEKQISPLLSKRFADGLLSRRLVEVNGKWLNVYKKAAELPAKFTSTGSVVSDIIEAQTATEAKVVGIVSQQAIPGEKPEVFEVALKIKGVEISLNEFSSLYRELHEAGFVRDMHKSETKKPRMLTTSHVIKGVTFNRDELNVLTSAMHSTAGHFKQALVI